MVCLHISLNPDIYLIVHSFRIDKGALS